MTAGSHGILNFSENFSMVAAHFSENDTNTKWFTDINKVQNINLLVFQHTEIRFTNINKVQ